MSVPQYTTPTFVLTFMEEGLDLTQARNVYVTFRSGSYVITKSGADLEIGEKTISVYLSQEDTSNFMAGGLELQANWTTDGGGRAASDIVIYPVTEQLLKKVVE